MYYDQFVKTKKKESRGDYLDTHRALAENYTMGTLQYLTVVKCLITPLLLVLDPNEIDVLNNHSRISFLSC